MDMPGTDLSLSAAVLGAVQGQLGGFFHKYMDYKYRIKHLKTSANLQDISNARSINIPSFSITRRILSIMIIFIMCILPFASFFTGLPILVFYSDSNGWLSSIVYGNYSIKIISTVGVPVLPELCYLSTLIGTLYFVSKDN
jgi:hypothetical protein